jgi:hypothetical protein
MQQQEADTVSHDGVTRQAPRGRHLADEGAAALASLIATVQAVLCEYARLAESPGKQTSTEVKQDPEDPAQQQQQQQQTIMQLQARYVQHEAAVRALLAECESLERVQLPQATDMITGSSAACEGDLAGAVVAYRCCRCQVQAHLFASLIAADLHAAVQYVTAIDIL